MDSAGRAARERRTKDGARKHYNPAGFGFPTHRLATSVMMPACLWRSRSRSSLLRLPSLVQPMGADQALYAYVGERIRAGGLPTATRGIRSRRRSISLYAGLRAVWPHDAVVPAADLAAAAAIAVLLYRLGRRWPAPPGPAPPRRCSSCCCRTRRSRGSAASACGAVRDVHRPGGHRGAGPAPAQGEAAAAGHVVWRRRALRPRLRPQVQRRGLRRRRRRGAVAARVV